MSGFVINALENCPWEVAIGYVGKISSSVLTKYLGRIETYTPEFIAYVSEHVPDMVHLLGL